MLKKAFFISLVCFSSIAMSATTYEIEKSIDDEIFIINGEVFKAKTYCFGMDEGDDVIFIKGSAFGACASATIYNTSSEKTCEVWCE